MNATKHYVTTRSVEYRVSHPFYGKDLEDALKWAIRDMLTAGIEVYDDSLSVRMEDETLVIWRNMTEGEWLQRPDGEMVTKTGRVLTEDDVQSLADEAEAGYDVSHLRDWRKREWGEATCDICGREFHVGGTPDPGKMQAHRATHDIGGLEGGSCRA